MILDTTPAPTVRPPFADGEAQAFGHGDGGDELDGHFDVVAGHDHFDAFGQLAGAGHVRGAEVELGAVAVEEGGVAAAFFLGEDVDFGLELRVGRDGTGFGDNLAALDVVAS
jgi:hypothetical protein